MHPFVTAALSVLLLAACHAPVVGAPHISVAPTERWRPHWTIVGHFVADLGASLLVRHARTSEDVTFTLYSANTGAREHDLPWLATALPRWERTYTHRFHLRRAVGLGHRGASRAPRPRSARSRPAPSRGGSRGRPPSSSSRAMTSRSAFVIDSAQPRVGRGRCGVRSLALVRAEERTPRDARGGDPRAGRSRSRATRTTPKSRARWWRGP
jgi:hypothetical protein